MTLPRDSGPADNLPNEEELNIETAVLDSLLGEGLNKEQRELLLRMAGPYPFRNVHCRVIVESLAGLRPLPAADLKRELVAALTRAGFPDLALDHHFSATVTGPEYERLRAILEGIEAPGRRDQSAE